MSVGFSVLSSGSKGNSLFIQGPGGALVIDAGLSAREILKRLSDVGQVPSSVRGILLTHEHTDHVRGVRPLARKLKVPVYGTAETLRVVDLPMDIETVPLRSGQRFHCHGFDISPFSIPHDAGDPVGFVLAAGPLRVGVATDLGYGTSLVKERLKGCQAVVLESNHDEKMLMEGPYPWFLKQRVRSRTGHLSNSASSVMLESVRGSDLQIAVLAHLSEVNNSPELALASAVDVVRVDGGGPRIEVASVSTPLPMIWLEE